MFGRNNTNETVMGSPTVQNPSALDNVSSSPAASPSQSVITPSTPATDDQQGAGSASGSPFSVSSTPIPADVIESVEKSTNPPVISRPVASDNSFTGKGSQTAEPESAQDPLVSTQDAEDAIIASAVDKLTQPASSLTAAPSGTMNSNAGPVMPPQLGSSAAADAATGAQDVATDTDESTPVMPSDSQRNEEYLEQLTTDETLADKITSIPIDKVKLADMKKRALDDLEPLTDHLGGTPEETFKTTMMMIQANDNHTLIERALEAAQKIEDDKARAQALLDIINEINYFSQNADTQN